MPDWAFAGMAAAAVAVLIGSVALLSALRDTDGPTVTNPPPTTSMTVPDGTNPDVPATPVVLVSPEPIIGGEDPDKGVLKFFSVGDIVTADGVFHALLGVESEDPAYFVHATSSDGSSWSVDPEPVSATGVVDAKHLRATTLLEMSDGSWVGFFDVSRDLGGFGDHLYRYWVHRGTAPDVGGPWTIDPSPVLDAGPDGSWDAGWVRNASVIGEEGSWVMYYLGGSVVMDGPGSGAVGVATSADGITWTKRQDPVFVADDSRFEDGGLNRIQVKEIDGRLLLTYAGKTGGNRGLAWSDDGLEWTRDIRNPVLTNLEVPRSIIYDTALIVDGEDLRWYVGAGGFSSMALYELRLDR